MTPFERITAYFAACSEGTEADIAGHFVADAVIYDTNIKPVAGNDEIGRMWVKVRERWGGARWTVDSIVTGPDQDVSPQTEPEAAAEVAAIEWSMTGSAADGRPFTFRGSEHYRFENTLIAEIRQYWTFDPKALDTGLLGFEYD